MVSLGEVDAIRAPLLSLPLLGLVYLVLGCAGALYVGFRRQSEEPRARDVALTFALWPIYLPLVMKSRGSRGGGRGEAESRSPLARELLSVLDSVQACPLAAALPDADHLVRLSARVDLVAARSEALAKLLATPEFSRTKVSAHIESLRSANASAAAIRAAEGRFSTLGELARRRELYDSELVELSEVVAQLRTQVELLRLGDLSYPSSSSEDVVGDLRARLEGLDAVLLPLVSYPRESAIAEPGRDPAERCV